MQRIVNLSRAVALYQPPARGQAVEPLAPARAPVATASTPRPAARPTGWMEVSRATAAESRAVRGVRAGRSYAGERPADMRAVSAAGLRLDVRI